jgi:hypothetical protein
MAMAMAMGNDYDSNSPLFYYDLLSSALPPYRTAFIHSVELRRKLDPF